MDADDPLRASIEARLRELRRTVAELEALLDDTDAGPDYPQLAPVLDRPDGDSAHTFRRGARGSRPGRDGRAPYGDNRRQILEAIVAQPGITAPEIAEQTGINSRVVS